MGKAALIDLPDLIRDLQHRGAPRHQLLVKERIAQLVTLLLCPVERGLQNLPVRIDLAPQSLKRALFTRVERAGIPCAVGVAVVETPEPRRARRRR